MFYEPSKPQFYSVHIFFHQSQKDGVMYQGNDQREFWVRAEQRNAETAKKYRNLGLSDYQAIEAFKRYHF